MKSQLTEYMPVGALGFLPHREAAEIWILLQGQIELMLAYDEPFFGLGSDVRRAFKHFGRRQVFHMGTRLGLPSTLLTAWNSFLSNLEKRIGIRGCLGNSISSDNGFPEGDPLSIVAMLTVNWGYHVYMRVFAPQVQAYSFVGNLLLAACEAQLVIQGYFAMLSFTALFDLSMDDEKTYVWGLQSSTRRAMRQLGLPCLYDASDLGASMSYGV